MWSALLAAAAISQPSSCEPLPGWEDVAQQAAGSYLVLGEIHGSQEAPAATAEYVCAVSQDGPVLLAIEFSSITNEGWQRAWSAPHAQFRERLFEEVAEWGQRDDGVASAAMLNMLVRLHALKEAGLDIDIVAFNGSRGESQTAAFSGLLGQEPHEAAQAANIREAAQAREYRHVVILVGNLHAQKAAFSARNIDVRAMAMLLAPPERVVALNMHVSGGATWSCQLDEDTILDPTGPITADMIVCASYPVGTSRPALSRGFHLDPAVSRGIYDGVFALGAVSASPPAVID